MPKRFFSGDGSEGFGGEEYILVLHSGNILGVRRLALWLFSRGLLARWLVSRDCRATEPPQRIYLEKVPCIL